MDPKVKFNIKTFLYYLVVEPWSEELRLPNMKTILWIFIVIFFIFRVNILLWITLSIQIILYLIQEYKSGQYIHWYREKMYGDRNKALKEVRQKKKLTKKTKNLNTN